jgi:hypothetical protein
VSKIRYRVTLGEPRSVLVGPHTLLIVSGMGLLVGHALSLYGFGGWAMIALAGLVLFMGGCLWGDWPRFVLPASGAAVLTALLCAFLLPGQVAQGAYLAAVVNLGIIAALLATSIANCSRWMAKWPLS